MRINRLITEQVVDGGKVPCLYTLTTRGMVLHSKAYKRAPRRNNSTVLYKTDGTLKAGIVLRLIVVEGTLLATVQRLQLLNVLPSALLIPDNVAASLHTRVLCCMPSNRVQVIEVKDITEKCLCINGFGSDNLLYLVRFPTKLRFD